MDIMKLIDNLDQLEGKDNCGVHDLELEETLTREKRSKSL